MMRHVMLAMALVAAGPAAAQTVSPPANPATRSPAAAKPGAIPPKLYDAPGPVSKSAPVNGVLTLYGNERCPTDNDGNEVVVCQRRSAAEQYRVPKELRELQVTPENASWAAKAKATTDTGVGVSSVGSCSVVGPGGQSGCFAQAARAARAESAARKQAETPVP